MDNTSKNYYEAVMRDYKAYARGRTLEQYCRDEAVDYHWMIKAQTQYGDITEEKPRKKSSRKTKAEPTNLIRLHFEDDGPVKENPSATTETEEASATAEANKTESWRVGTLRIISPSGDEIEIRTSTPSAVSELLAKLAV